MPDVGAQSMLGGWALAQHPDGTGTCFRSVVGDPIVPSWGRLSPEGWYNVGFCVMQLLTTGVLVGVIHVNSRAARRGDYAASKRLILPVYHRIVMLLVVFDIISVLVIVLRLAAKESDCHSADCPPPGSDAYRNAELYSDAKSVLVGLDWAILHWVIDGVAVFLCQPSAGQRSMNRAGLLGAVPALCSFAMGYMKHHSTVEPYHACLRDVPPSCVEGACGSSGDDLTRGPGPSDISCRWVPLAYQVALLLVYMRVWLAPAHEVWIFPRVFRREAAIDYVRFWSVFRMLTLVSAVFLTQPFSVPLVDIGFCMDFAVEAFIFTVGKAWYIYTALRDDSAYWQCEPPRASSSRALLPAVLQRSRSGGSRVSGVTKAEAGYSLSSPLVGRVDIESADAEVINDGLYKVGQFDQSIVISPGFLQINKKDVLGYGGTARVYRAKLRGDDVAAKVMFCPSIEPVMVRNFFKEAMTLKKLAHPNIVALRGVCCLPPTVCIVMELCAGGSLTGWLSERRPKWFPDQSPGSPDDESDRQILPVFDRRALSICRIMQDAVAGVIRIHEEGLVHLDIKSMNFLVAKREVDRGRVRTRAEETLAEKLDLDEHTAQSDAAVTVKLADLENTAITADFGHEFGSRTDRFHTSHSEIEVPDTLDWTAPELLREGGSAATMKSDVYALAMTLWEVVTFCMLPPTESLSPPTDAAATDSPSNADAMAGSVKEKLLAGWRPTLDGTGIPEGLRITLESAWSGSVEDRPTAAALLQDIEAFVAEKEGVQFSTADAGVPSAGS
jgi:serine/threonine protein kinase